MDNRTRIIHDALGGEIDRQPFFFYFGPWDETLKLWHTQGLPEGAAWNFEAGLDPGIRHVEVNLGYCPAFPRQIIRETDTSIMFRDELGILQESRKDSTSIPRYLDYPVKDRESWEKLKAERLNPDDPARFPQNWDALVRTYNDGDQAMQLGLYPYGLFGTLRDMMGVEALLLAFYDDPELIHDMMDSLTDLWLAIYEKVCRAVKVDIIHIWEDMSGKNGSLISPAMVREFMLPNYKRISAFAQAHEIPVIALDTDGDCMELVPLFLEGGINLVMPFEVAAGCDILEYRKRFPKLCIMGGIDKQEVARGPAAIERELDRIDAMFQGTRYMAALDHLFHPEISYKDFLYFCAAVKRRIDKYACK